MSRLSNEAAKQRYATMRGRLAVFKMASGCVDCGYNVHPDALDFDHVGDDKVRDISHLMGRGWEHMMDEVEKCEVVCSNCHRQRTAARKERVVV